MMDRSEREEILNYRELYRETTPEQLFEMLREMHAFAFGRMSAEEIKQYEALRERLNRTDNEKA